MTYTTTQFRAAVLEEIQEALGSVGAHYVTLGIVEEACRRLEVEIQTTASLSFKVGERVHILVGEHNGKQGTVLDIGAAMVHVGSDGKSLGAYRPTELIGIVLTADRRLIKVNDPVKVITIPNSMDPPRMGDEGIVVQVLTSPNMCVVQFPDGQQVYYLKENLKQL